MITDKDITKLKKVFATDFKKINNKLDRMSSNSESMGKDIITVIEMIGETNQNVKEISQKLDKKTIEHDDILENHEKRLDKVEGKVFATT